MIITPNVKKIYASLQKQLFYLVPEKWDKIYLYASVTQQIVNLETGELFFYYFPKGILKKNPVNVYEIPNKFSLDEENYIKLVEKLYDTIKKLWDIYKFSNEKVWTNITIKIEGVKFEIEFNYDNLSISNYSPLERHIIWKYKYLKLPLESFNRKDRKLIQAYLEKDWLSDDDNTETYTESIYKRPIKNLVDYNKEDTSEEIEEEYITEAELLEKEAKQKLNERKSSYTKKGRKTINKQNEKEKKELTYIEQVEAQRKAVKSQILNH